MACSGLPANHMARDLTLDSIITAEALDNTCPAYRPHARRDRQRWPTWTSPTAQAVLPADGAPCQPFSPSSNDLIHHYVAIRDALAERCHRQGV